MDDYTRKFNAAEDKDQQVHYILTTVYESLKEKGYDPINQIVGYILSRFLPISAQLSEFFLPVRVDSRSQMCYNLVTKIATEVFPWQK